MIKHELELDVKDCKINSTVLEDTCFVNIPEDEIKLENTEIQGKLDSFHLKNTEIQGKLDSFHFQGVELRAITRISNLKLKRLSFGIVPPPSLKQIYII